VASQFFHSRIATGHSCMWLNDASGVVNAPTLPDFGIYIYAEWITAALVEGYTSIHKDPFRDVVFVNTLFFVRTLSVVTIAIWSCVRFCPNPDVSDRGVSINLLLC